MVRWYQRASLALLVGQAARLMAASTRYWPTERPWSRLGSWPFDELDQVQLLGLVPEGGDVAEAGGAGALWGDGFLGGGDGLEDMFEGAEVGGFDDFRFAVDALALAGVVVGAAVDGFGGEGGHYVRSYNG